MVYRQLPFKLRSIGLSEPVLCRPVLEVVGMRIKRNATSTTLRPDPPRPTIHNHAPSAAPVIAVLFICGIIGVVLGWHFLVYVFAKFGARDPEQDLATVIIALIIIAIIGFFAKFILIGIIRMFLDNKIELEEIRLQMAQQQQLTATVGAPAGRALGVDEKFAKLVLLVMHEAYNHLAAVGQYEHSDAKPWSWRQAIRHTIGGENIPEQMARRVRPFLEGNGVITGDIIQVGKYERLDDIRAMLDRRYNVPVAYNATPLPHSANSGYEFTDENARMG